jgi:hypothetical protein
LARSDNKKKKSEEKPIKKQLMVIKGSSVTQSDYRAFIAILLSAAFILALFVKDVEAIAALGPLSGSAATYYFHKKAVEDRD